MNSYLEEMNASNAYILHAYLLFANGAPRWVNVFNRQTKQSDSVPVLNLLVADRTGPITIELWRQCAEDTLAKVEQWEKRIRRTYPS